MHIVFINPEYPSASGKDHGGIATYTYCMANALVAENHTVTILARRGTIPDPLHPSVSFNVVDPRSAGSPRRYIDRLRNSPVTHEESVSRAMEHKVQEIHKKHPVDIVEIPEYGGLAWAFTRARNRNSFRIVIHFHTPSILVDQLNKVLISATHRSIHTFEARALQNAHGYKSPSWAMSTECMRLFALSAPLITIIPHPIAPAPFRYISRISHPHVDYHILFVGRLECRKGAELLLNSIEPILDLDTRIHVTIAGETMIGSALNYRDSIEHALSESKRGRVWFLGPIPRSSLPLLYARSDLLIMPSLFENAPYTLYEAMASGLPVAVADSGGLPESIRHGSNGLLFKHGDPTAFVECIKQAIENPAAAIQRADIAYQDLCEQHNPTTIICQALSHYHSIAQGTR